MLYKKRPSEIYETRGLSSLWCVNIPLCMVVYISTWISHTHHSPMSVTKLGLDVFSLFSLLRYYSFFSFCYFLFYLERFCSQIKYSQGGNNHLVLHKTPRLWIASLAWQWPHWRVKTARVNVQQFLSKVKNFTLS